MRYDQWVSSYATRLGRKSLPERFFVKTIALIETIKNIFLENNFYPVQKVKYMILLWSKSFKYARRLIIRKRAPTSTERIAEEYSGYRRHLKPGDEKHPLQKLHSEDD